MKGLKSLTGAVALASLIGCSQDPLSNKESPIIANKRVACEKLVAGVLALDQVKLAGFGGVPVEFRGNTRSIQIQRDLKNPDQLSSVKVVQMIGGKHNIIPVGTSLEGVSPEYAKEIHDNAEKALGPSQSLQESSPKMVPTCEMINGNFSVGTASNYPHYRNIVMQNTLKL